MITFATDMLVLFNRDIAKNQLNDFGTDAEFRMMAEGRGSRVMMSFFFESRVFIEN